MPFGRCFHARDLALEKLVGVPDLRPIPSNTLAAQDTASAEEDVRARLLASITIVEIEPAGHRAPALGRHALTLGKPTSVPC